jgi:hypothetical protein
LANTWICRVLGWANTPAFLGYGCPLSIPPRRAMEKKTDPVAAEAMAEKRPADSGPEEAITDTEEGPKRPRREELTEAEQ